MGVEGFVLEGEQVQVLEGVKSWFAAKDKQSLSVGGYAGTGKTYLIAALLMDDMFSGLKVSVATFTGKAVSVLARKGVTACTIHSLIYVPIVEGTKVTFVKSEDLVCDIIIIDEASMVTSILYRDLMSFNIPILFVGDMGQLEPIGDDPKLMANPELKLTTIHRQAATSPIVQLSKQIRDKVPVFRWMRGESYDRDKLLFGSRTAYKQHIESVDQVICGYNKTRHAVNTMVRKRIGLTEVLEVGDSVICLQNSKKYNVFNGLMAKVTKVTPRSSNVFMLDVTDDLGRDLKYIPVCISQFGMDAIPYEERSRELTYWDYGYCITAHKSQGSSWGSVLVIEELHASWDSARWRYTAATRAENTLIYCK